MNKLSTNQLIFISNFVWNIIGQRNIGEVDDSELLNNIGIFYLSIIEDLISVSNDISEDEWDKLEYYFENRVMESQLVNTYIDEVEKTQKEMS